MQDLCVADKAKPSCGQCSRSGHFCRGYEPVLRMQHYVAMSQDNARSACVATKRLTIPNDGCLTRAAMAKFDEEVHSYFHSVYQWAPFWYPWLKRAIDAGSPTVNRLCSLAVIYGCMGKELKAQTMMAKSQAFYAEALHRARALIEQTDKKTLAKLVPAVLMMAMYEVNTLSIRNKCIDVNIYKWSVQELSGNTHIDGLNQILEYCGPKFFEQEALISIYRSCRVLHVSYITV